MMRLDQLLLATVATFVFLGGCVVNGASEDETRGAFSTAEADLVATGRGLAVRECSSCHAIDQEMKSPRAEAPAMRTLLSRYDPDMLAEDLIEGVRVGHDDMPFFDFNVMAADALVAYLKSIDRGNIGR